MTQMDRELGSSHRYQELAGEFTTRLDVLLAAKRTLLRAWLKHSRWWHGRVHDVFGAETAEAALDRLHADIDALHRRRDRWVPRSSPADPRYWIATYDRLARVCEQAAGTSPGPEGRQLLELARRYRRRQQDWQRRAAESPPGEAEPSPAEPGRPPGEPGRPPGEPGRPPREPGQLPASVRASSAKSSTTRSGA